MIIFISDTIYSKLDHSQVTNKNSKDYSKQLSTSQLIINKFLYHHLIHSIL